MKISGLSKKAIRFEGMHSNIELILEKNGPIIRIIELDNRLRVMIEVRENSTHDQIRDIISNALFLKKEIDEFSRPMDSRWPKSVYGILD